MTQMLAGMVIPSEVFKVLSLVHALKGFGNILRSHAC